MTDEERSCGFVETTLDNQQRATFEASRVRAVVRYLGGGLMAVKVESPVGDARYLLSDVRVVAPLSRPLTLAELLRAYPAIEHGRA